MVRRLFTPSQANATLPLVRRIVVDILGCGRELRTLARSGARAASVGPERRDSVRPESARADRAHVEDLQHRLRALMAELEEIGCSYRDFGFEQGLVDFPGKIGSERVLLCWRSDEPAVLHYHGYRDGFAGRRPIPAHLMESDLDAEAAQDATA